MKGESKYIKPHCRRAFFAKKDIFVWFYKEYIIDYMRKKIPYERSNVLFSPVAFVSGTKCSKGAL